MYKVENEKLNLWSCCLEDLTEKQRRTFVEALGESDLVHLSFFMDEDLRIVLNRENKDFKAYKDLIEAHMQHDEQQREYFKEQVAEHGKTLLSAVLTLERMEQIRARKAGAAE